MRRIYTVYKCFVLLLIFLLCINLNAQFTSEAKITNTDFEIDGDKMIITYDIENYSANETFYINAQIFYETGEKINSKSFSGDVKGNITGGSNKTIIWDISQDIDILEGAIFVEITAIPEAISEKPEIEEMVDSYTIIGTLVPSLAFPGYGESLQGGIIVQVAPIVIKAQSKMSLGQIRIKLEGSVHGFLCHGKAFFAVVL